MADFRTHITTSTVLGVCYGAGAYYYFGLPGPSCVVAATLCSVAGMLPDLDSDSGIPIRETLGFVAVLIPALMWERFWQLGWSPELLAFAAVVTYIIIRFGVGAIFRRFTKHRGMWHSIPAALIAGLATFLFSLSTDLGIRLFKSWAVVLGFVSHLALDEIYAVDWRGRAIRVKKSFGTALKLFGEDRWANFATYGKLIFLCLLVLGDHALMNHLGRQPIQFNLSAWNWFDEEVHELQRLRR